MKKLPVTTALVALIVTGWLVTSFSPGVEGLILNSLNWKSAPWTLLTYAFVTSDLIGALVSCLWIWMIGAKLEPDLGSGKLVAFFGLSNLVVALCALGAAPFAGPLILAGMMVTLPTLTAFWAGRYPWLTVFMFGFVPLRAPYVALVTMILMALWFPPILLPFLALPAAAAYIVGQYRTPARPANPTERYAKNFKEGEAYRFDVAERMREREERARLRKLFESSESDADPKD